MEKHYKILQLRDLQTPYIWRSYSRALDNNFSLEDYDVVYDAHIDVDEFEDDEQTLDRLWVMFNMDHPGDFEGRSMSVSDIIEFDDATYYVDSVGFKKIK